MPTVSTLGFQLTNPPSHAVAAGIDVVAAFVRVDDAPVDTGERNLVSLVAEKAPDEVNPPDAVTAPLNVDAPEIVDVPENVIPPEP